MNIEIISFGKFTKSLLVLWCLGVALSSSAQGVSSIRDIAPLKISANTGEKPQSKVWNYNNEWWAVLPDSTGTYIWQLNRQKNKPYFWERTLRISESDNTYADCKLNGNLVHILLFDKNSSPYSASLISVEFNNKTNEYKVWSKNPEILKLDFANKSVETASLELDGKNNIWIAYELDNKINLRRSKPPYKKWSSEVVICEGVYEDDICAIVSLKESIGVLWSNQKTKRFGFKYQKDNSALDEWSEDEVPGSEYALNVGEGMADDHLNMVVAKDGTLYCAVKTSYDTEGYAKIGLLVRSRNGEWSKLFKVSDTGTRPIVVLDEAKQKIKVLYTSTEAGGSILYKESDCGEISFSNELVLIGKDRDARYNNVSSSKNTYNAEIVFLSSFENQLRSVIAK